MDKISKCNKFEDTELGVKGKKGGGSLALAVAQMESPPHLGLLINVLHVTYNNDPLKLDRRGITTPPPRAVCSLYN